MMISALAAAALAGRRQDQGDGEPIDEDGNVIPLEASIL